MQKFVLVVLADAHNGHTGQCNPSISRISDTTGYSKRAVIDALKALEAKGYIGALKRFGRSTAYELSFQETGAPPAPVTRSRTPPRKRPTSAPDAPVEGSDQASKTAETSAGDAPVQETHRCASFTEPVQEVHRTGAGGAPEPGKNLEGNREDEETVVRVGAGWVVTDQWQPPEAALIRARSAGVPQTLIDDPGILADFCLKYSEAPQRDPAFAKRWVSWVINEHRNPRAATPADATAAAMRWARGDG